MPHYLPYSLTHDEPDWQEDETAFLIYSFAPAEEFKGDTKNRLADLNASQIRGLVHFLEWLQLQPNWIDFCPSEISRALEFMHEIERFATRG